MKKFHRLTIKKKTPNHNLALITWNNLGEGIFEQSVFKHGLSCAILGKKIHNWSNYFKFDLTVNYLKNLNVDYVVGCDSHDALLLNDPNDMLNKFVALDCEMLFNGERRFYPDVGDITSLWKENEYKRFGGRYPFLNAGAWIAKRDFAINFFSECNKVRIYDLMNCERYAFLKKDSIGCDQSSIHATLAKFPEVRVDSNSVVFQNTAHVESDELHFTPTVL